MSRYEVDRHMDHLERVQEFASRDAFLGRSITGAIHNLQLERQYRRERDVEVEVQRRRRLEREGLERLQREYLGGVG